MIYCVFCVGWIQNTIGKVNHCARCWHSLVNKYYVELSRDRLLSTEGFVITNSCHVLRSECIQMRYLFNIFYWHPGNVLNLCSCHPNQENNMNKKSHTRLISVMGMVYRECRLLFRNMSQCVNERIKQRFFSGWWHKNNIRRMIDMQQTKVCCRFP